MPNEISKTQKDQCCMIPLTEGPRVVKFRDRKQNRGYPGLGVGRVVLLCLLIDTEFRFGMMTKFGRQMVGVDGRTPK